MRPMSAALKLVPETEQLTQKPPLGEKRLKPQLVWDNPKLTDRTQKGKSDVKPNLSYGRVLYNYFRYYDPATDRYLTSDPIGLGGGLNTYIYAESNPIRNTDPLGLESSTTRGLPRSPTPFDVFMPGSRANDAFRDSTTRMFSDIFGGDGNAEDAGEDAADELDDDAQCPGAEDNGHGPN